eukprot:8119556-Prorocentrum_lima.AAC.1
MPRDIRRIFWGYRKGAYIISFTLVQQQNMNLCIQYSSVTWIFEQSWGWGTTSDDPTPIDFISKPCFSYE